MVWNCYSTVTFLSNFDENFAQQLLPIIHCQHCMLILYLQGSHLYYRIFGTTFVLSDHLWILLILVKFSEALFSSLNSCNIRRQKSHFGKLIIEGYVCFKTVVFLKIIYKLLMSIKTYLKWITILVLKCIFATLNFKRTIILQ